MWAVWRGLREAKPRVVPERSYARVDSSAWRSRTTPATLLYRFCPYPLGAGYTLAKPALRLFNGNSKWNIDFPGEATPCEAT